VPACSAPLPLARVSRRATMIPSISIVSHPDYLSCAPLFPSPWSDAKPQQRGFLLPQNFRISHKVEGVNVPAKPGALFHDGQLVSPSGAETRNPQANAIAPRISNRRGGLKFLP